MEEVLRAAKLNRLAKIAADSVNSRSVKRISGESRTTLQYDLLVSRVATDRLATLMILYRGECRNTAISGLLVECLHDESGGEILRHLGLRFRYHHKDARAIGPILPLIDHPDWMIRTCVANTLGA